ncbi:Trehalose-phosphatase, partial [Globisporangium splendens]
MAAAATSSAASTHAHAPLGERRQRLSVSHANALENFSFLQQAHFKNHRIVVFLDYDGTLTPIVSDPASALLPSQTRATLEKVRGKFTTGVISGRSLDKIQKFVGIPELYYAGSHGFDIAGPNGTTIKNQVASEFVNDLRELHDALAERIADIPKAQVEDNVFSVSMHYRNVDPAYHDKITEIAEAVGSQHPNIRCNRGKMVFEFKPKIDWNKGKALVWLLQALGLDQHEEVFTIYIGDDTTDEDAFDVFRTSDKRKGMGIIVTEHSTSTGAYFTLHDTNEVRQFLEKLVEHESDKVEKSSNA